MDRIHLKLLRRLISLLEKAEIRTIRENQQSERERAQPPNCPTVVVRAELNLPVAATNYYESKERNKWGARLKTVLEVSALATAIWLGFLNLGVLKQIKTQTPEISKSATAAHDAAKTAADALEIGNRPWIRVTHRIVKPLNFTFVGASGPAAVMTVEDTLENVGQTIALNVLSWEDVIPLDADFTRSTAAARQREWCDANRNSPQSKTVGSILFPHTPVLQSSRMGPLMTTVNRALATSPIKGKVGFAMVGCVVYRSSFEPVDRANHQTRFIYYLALPESFGGFMPFIKPNGIAPSLRLMEDFRTYTAD